MESDNNNTEHKVQQNKDKSLEKEIKLNNETNNVIVEPIQNPIFIKTNQPIVSSLFVSKGRANDLDFIWKVQIKKEKFLSSFSQFQVIKGRDDKENYIALIYVFYNTSMSGSLLCLFKNGLSQSQEEFKKEMSEVHNKFLSNQEEIEEGNTGNELNNLNGEDKTISQASLNNNKGNNTPSIHTSSKSYSYSQSSKPKKSREHSLDGLRVDENNNNESNVPNNLIDNHLKSNKEENSNNHSETNSIHNSNTTFDNNSSEDSNPSYDVTLNLTLIDSKRIAASYKSIAYDFLVIKEMKLNTNSLMLLEDESIVVFEIKRSKNYPKSNKFTGLINEGMTCYMNSMIQSLNVLGYFKKGVFRIPFEGTNTVAYSLQRLFYELTFENELASTNRLIESFGWSRDLIFVQHDVQEFNMMLSDLMEKKMKGTKAEGSFKFLFEGKILNCIQCIDYDYTSKKEEIFNDLQLNVKGCKNIYCSLNKFTEEEILDNDNKYLVEGHGKEKAKKMLKFLSLPPVLIFQLKRFEYNPQKDEMDKLDDYFEFEPLLDMSAYLPLDENKDAQYALISIVVHKGNVHGGHYYSFIRSSIENDDWYCFNDEIVRKADLYEVFDINYGGTYTLFRHREKGIITELYPWLDSSAYILIYIKVNQAPTLLQQITIEDIPKEIINAIHSDKERERQEILLEERREKYMDIFLITKETLCNYQGIGISRGNAKITLEPITYEDPHYLTSINLNKKLKVKHLYSALMSIFNCNSAQIDLFLFCLKNPNRITKRNDSGMRYLSDQYLDTELNNLLYEANENIKLVKRVYIYISATKNDTHFAPLVLKESHSIDDDDNDEDVSLTFQSKHRDFLFFVSSTNKYELNQEKRDNTVFNLRKDNGNDALLSNDKKLFILKRFDFIKNGLDIFDMITIGSSSTSTTTAVAGFESLIKETLSYYRNQYTLKGCLEEKDMKIVYLIENTSDVHCANKENNDEDQDNEFNDPFEEINKFILYNNSTVAIDDNPFINIIYNFSKLIKDNSDNDCLIIIPYVYYEDHDSCSVPMISQIKDIYSLYKYKVIIPLCFSPSYSYLSIKLSHHVFYLNESDDMIKLRVFSSISIRDFFQMLSLEKESNNSYIYNNRKELIPLAEYCKSLTANRLSLKKKISIESIEYPLLKYIGNFNKAAYEIEFEILTIDESDNSNYSQFLLALIDKDCNQIVDIDIHLPSSIALASEVIEYLYEGILKSFYSEWNYSKEQFQLIYYNSSKNYIVNLLPGRINLQELNKKSMTILKYCVMPVIDQNDKTIVIRVAFQTSFNAPLCLPILLFEPLDVLVSKIKTEIFEKIQKLNQLALNREIDVKDIKKMKFYTYSIINYTLNKEILIISNKDNETLTSLFKPSTYGLLVEFLPKETGQIGEVH